MTDLDERLHRLRRPSLLIRAARLGLAGYSPRRDLPRIIKGVRPASQERIVAALLDVEEEIEQTRRQGTAGYSVMRHIDVMTAMLGEAQALRSAARA
jgi:hypothetical protein